MVTFYRLKLGTHLEATRLMLFCGQFMFVRRDTRGKLFLTAIRGYELVPHLVELGLGRSGSAAGGVTLFPNPIRPNLELCLALLS